MKRAGELIICLLVMSFPNDAEGQNPVGAWSDHLSYFSATGIALSEENVYASTGNAIMYFNREFSEMGKITRVQGLSESGISTIAWSADQQSLVVAYSSTNVDIIRNKIVYNIPDIKRKYISGKKEINRIKTSGKYAYLACSFGIVVLDLAKKEVYDTWKPGPGSETTEVLDLVIYAGRIFAATGSGIYFADTGNPGLSYYENWNRVDVLPSPSGYYNSITESGGKIYVNRAEKFAAGDTVYVIDDDASLFLYRPGLFNLSMDSYQGGFTITARGTVSVFSQTGLLIKDITSYSPGSLNAMHALADGDDIWIADLSLGLIRGENMTSFQKLNLPGPYTNNVLSINSTSGKTFITGGAVDNAWNNLWRPLQVFINENNNWHSEISYELKDAMRVLPDPAGTSRFWVSTWGGGLLEYENNVLLNKYDATNSPLQTIIPGQPYTRICGLAMDKDRNIWITQTGVPGSIKVLRPDRSWITIPVTIEAPTIGDMIISGSGYKWIVLPRGYGLFVYDDNNSPDVFTDDRYKQLLIKDTDNKIISNVYSIAEDLDGNIWVGTDQGPAIYYNPRQIFDEDPRAYRVKVPRNDGTGLADYMLGTETITSVSVDGANRKWLGTFSSGAYLLSADGTEKLINYNEENSPLLSNTVVALDVDEKSGEVWFGTAKGVISVRGDATGGADAFRDVYAFPNPVRETWEGNVTITGLMRNTQVRITDISGNLVHSTVSDGGQASWDLKTYNGERVSTGVYLVFCASEDGTSAFVTKMLIIK